MSHQVRLVRAYSPIRHSDRYGASARRCDLSYDDNNDSASDSYAGDESSDNDHQRSRRDTAVSDRHRREPGWRGDHPRHGAGRRPRPTGAGRRGEAVSDNTRETKRHCIPRMREAAGRGRGDREDTSIRISRRERERCGTNAHSNARIVVVDETSDEDSEHDIRAPRRRNDIRRPRGTTSSSRYDRRDHGCGNPFHRRIMIDSDGDEESDVPRRPVRRFRTMSRGVW